MVPTFKANMDLEIREVRKEEIENVKEMVRRAFSSNPNGKVADHGFFRQLEHVPLSSPEYFRAGFENGVPVTALMAVRFIVTMGIVPFKIAGYTGMGTDRSARGKGYASQLLQHYEKFLENRGYDGIVLHSAADMLYKKNGFEIVFGFGEFSFTPEGLGKYIQSEFELF
jgi:ribosomal protein S18 acetylase RimI-like enzyme